MLPGLMLIGLVWAVATDGPRTERRIAEWERLRADPQAMREAKAANERRGNLAWNMLLVLGAIALMLSLAGCAGGSGNVIGAGMGGGVMTTGGTWPTGTLTERNVDITMRGLGYDPAKVDVVCEANTQTGLDQCIVYNPDGYDTIITASGGQIDTQVFSDPLR